MKSVHPLDPIVARCLWADTQATVLSRVPELSLVAPPIESWPMDDGVSQWVTPMTGLDAITGPLIEVLERAKNAESDSFVHAQLDLAKADLFVAQVRSLIRGLNEKQVAWALIGIARCSTSIVTGDPSFTQNLSPSLVRRVNGLAQAVQSAENRGALLVALSDALTARLSAAVHIAGINASGLAKRLIVNRLIWVVPHKGMDPSVDLPWVSMMLGLPLDARVVQMVHRVAHVAMDTSRLRLSTRKERPADALLAELMRGVVGDPLLNVESGPAIVRMLSHLIEGKHLKGRVDDHRLAVRYLEPDSIRTVSAAWSDLVTALSEWDVLGSMAAGIEPVRRMENGWKMGLESIEDTVHWSMRVPRTRPQQEHVVVAVRMVELIESGGGGMDVRDAVLDRWEQCQNEHGLFDWVAEHGVAVFSCAASAIRFAIHANKKLISSDGLLPGPDEPIALAPGLRPSVGIAMGMVEGGTDGEMVSIGGPALARAISRCGSGKVEHGVHDPLQIRRLSTGDVGLSGQGVACGRSALLAALNRWGEPIHRFGDESVVCGISRDFVTYPVDAWAPDAGGTILFMSQGRVRGADIVEALWVDAHMLREIDVRDQGLAQGGEGMLASESPTVEVDDPFDGEEAGDVAEADPFGFGNEGPNTDSEAAPKDGTRWDDIGFGDGDGSKR